jgi:Cobalamin biosynthesis protein CbiG
MTRECCIVAGIGCSTNVKTGDIVAALRLACEKGEVPFEKLSACATGARKAYHPAILEATQILDLPLIILDDAHLQEMAPLLITYSSKSEKETGIACFSEAAALAAAGSDARLLAPRIKHASVTCALAAGLRNGS